MNDEPIQYEPAAAGDRVLERLRRRRVLRLVIGYALALLVAFIAVRIELLNHAAGSILPNHEYVNNDPAEGPTKWRQSPFTTEARWRQQYVRDLAGQPTTRPLTPAECLQMGTDVSRGQANNQLRDFVETAGLLQYLLVPLLVATAVLVLRGDRPRLALPLIMVALVAAALMFHRAYFTSLGW